MNNLEIELKQLELLEKIHELLKPKTKPKSESTKRVSQRQFFIDSFVKENIFMEFIPFKMNDDKSIEQVKTLTAQITYKLLTQDQLSAVERQYKAMTDDQLRHLRNM